MEIVLKKITNPTLEGISCTLKEGIIIGVNGNSKENFYEFLKNFNYKSGSITIDGKKILKKDINENIKRIVFVEKFNYNLATFEENIRYQYSMNNQITKELGTKILMSLKMLGLNEEYLRRDINTLSTSEKKLLDISYALLKNPEVLILTNIFKYLDRKEEQKLIRLLNQLKEKKKMTIIIFSNDTDLLYKYTDYTFIIKDKKILCEGESKTLFQAVEFLEKEKIVLPKSVLFTYKAKKKKGIQLDYHKDIRDLIKDIYKHI